MANYKAEGSSKSAYQVNIKDTSVFLDVLVSCLDGKETLPNSMSYDRLFTLALRMYKDSDWATFFHRVIPRIKKEHGIHMQLNQPGTWSDQRLLDRLYEILRSYLVDGFTHADRISEDSFSCVRTWYVNVRKQLRIRDDLTQHPGASIMSPSDLADSIAAKTTHDSGLYPDMASDGSGQSVSSAGAAEVEQDSGPLESSEDDDFSGIRGGSDCDTATQNLTSDHTAGGISARHSYCIWRDHSDPSAEGPTIGIESPLMLGQALQVLQQEYCEKDFELLSHILSHSTELESQINGLKPIQKDLCMLSLLRFKPALVRSMACPRITDLSSISDDFMYGLAEPDVDYRPLSQKCLKVSYQASVGVMFLGALAFIFTGASLAFLVVGASMLLLGAVVYFSARSSVKKWNANQKKSYTIDKVRQSFLQEVTDWAQQNTAGPTLAE